MISVEWLDVAYLREVREQSPSRVHTIDCSPWIEELLRRIGLEYQNGSKMIRIFGYSPKNMDLFE